jgi:hypothetical protein
MAYYWQFRKKMTLPSSSPPPLPKKHKKEREKTKPTTHPKKDKDQHN